ncbi:hypothetical protein AALO_G00294980 [Alosa alosa]|uniref:G protein-regulated inducer of neurite outgrowth C-terminal domain-containing protein n=1 Tax=Alosa alosa TaxID=278164 RepID=A0AAV6FFR2_9TELE|nr:G protein-regulated inducer of neurite outgrowth 1 [Alosa alosa]KAG5260656.1 hypothetical protein AALO_G00294980 [Alosa alosa]
MDIKGSKPASSPQLPGSRGNKAEPSKDASSAAREPSGSKTAGRGDASAVMLTVGSGQKTTGSLEHVAQIHKPGQGSAKSHLTTHASEPKLHKSPNSSRAPASSSIDSPRTANSRHNLVVTTFRVPAKESPKTQHSRASTTSQIPVKDSPKTNSSAAKDTKNQNKLAASQIPVKVSPKITKSSSKTSMKESPSNTSSTPLSLSDDLSPVSDDGNLVHALRADVTPATASSVVHQEVKHETKQISLVKPDSQNPPKEGIKNVPSPRTLHKDTVTQEHGPQAQLKDTHKPPAQKEVIYTGDAQHKPSPHTTTKTQHEHTASLSSQAAHSTSAPGSQHSGTPKTKRQTTPQVTERQTAVQREKSAEKKGKESEGKGGMRSKDVGKSVATMTGLEGLGKDVGVQVSDDLCNGAVVTASQLDNHLTDVTGGNVNSEENPAVMRPQKPIVRQRPSSQYVCQIEIELCSQSQSNSAECPPLTVSGKPPVPSLSGKPIDGPDVSSDQSEVKDKTGEGPRQEKAGPVHEVTWDAQGLTWEVYGAALDWQALGSAVQRHLQTQIEQLELRLKALQSSAPEKKKESPAPAGHRPRRRCHCWFHCSSCCCRRKHHSA